MSILTFRTLLPWLIWPAYRKLSWRSCPRGSSVMTSWQFQDKANRKSSLPKQASKANSINMYAPHPPKKTTPTITQGWSDFLASMQCYYGHFTSHICNHWWKDGLLPLRSVGFKVHVKEHHGWLNSLHVVAAVCWGCLVSKTDRRHGLSFNWKVAAQFWAELLRFYCSNVLLPNSSDLWVWILATNCSAVLCLVSTVPVTLPMFAVSGLSVTPLLYGFV